MDRSRLLLAATTGVILFTGQAAFAEEPVFGAPTFYGRLNVTAEDTRVGGAESHVRLVDNGSRLGLRAGTVVIDGDTSVMIQLEARLRHDPNGWIDTSGSIVKSRDTWAGIQNARLGSVRYGMMEGPLYHATYDEISMHNHDSGHSSDVLLAEGATGGRMGRSLYYRAPVASPFKVELLHAFLAKDPAKANAANPAHDEFAVTYEHGESWIAGGFAESRNLNVDKAWTIAAATSVKGFILAGLYERSAQVSAGVGPTAFRSYTRVAVKYPIGSHEYHLNYGVAGNLSTTGDSGATQATLAYNYNLDDKSKVYAFATRVRNQRMAAYGFLGDTPEGASNSSIAVGYRRNF